MPPCPVKAGSAGILPRIPVGPPGAGVPWSVEIAFPDPVTGPWRAGAECASSKRAGSAVLLKVRLWRGPPGMEGRTFSFAEDYAVLAPLDGYRRIVPAEAWAELRARGLALSVPLPPASEGEAMLSAAVREGMREHVRRQVRLVRDLPAEEVLSAAAEVWAEEVMSS